MGIGSDPLTALPCPYLAGLHARLDGGNYFIYHPIRDDNDDDEDVDDNECRDSLFSLAELRCGGAH